MIKKLLVISALIASIYLLFNVGKQILDSLQAGKRVDTEVEKLQQLQKKNKELKGVLAEVNSLSFLEAQARNKFNMARPGETVVIISKQELDKVLGAQKIVQEIKLPNWQGWLNLFLKK